MNQIQAKNSIFSGAPLMGLDSGLQPAGMTFNTPGVGMIFNKPGPSFPHVFSGNPAGHTACGGGLSKSNFVSIYAKICDKTYKYRSTKIQSVTL
jgi:hypothetical protein